MEAIEYVYFKKMRPGTTKQVDEHHISISSAVKGGYRIPLNRTLTDMIIAKGCHYVSFAIINRTGERFLVFNNDAENGLYFPFPKKGNRSQCIVIYCKTMHQFIRNTLGMKESESKIWISDDLSKNNDSVVIEIKRD